MPDRYALRLRTALASNTGGPYTATWDRVLVPAASVVRTVAAFARAVTSNTITSKVDVYRQVDAAGSNTATSILVSPITIANDSTFATGVVAASGATLAAGDTLQLRTNTTNAGAKPAFLDLEVTVEVERIA